jgi:hypothetical protein
MRVAMNLGILLFEGLGRATPDDECAAAVPRSPNCTM